MLLLPLLLTCAVPEYRPSKCEACEIAVDEGYKFVRGLVTKRRGVRQAVNLAHEFPNVLREDRVNVWNGYSKVHRDNMKEHYLANVDPQKKHWKSVEVKFSALYGANGMGHEALAKEARAAGSLKYEDVYGIWKKECIDFSQWCKNSPLRLPVMPLTECGACREFVRELLISVRRHADTAHKVRHYQVEELLSDVCGLLVTHNVPKRAKYLQRVCEDVLQDEHGDHIASQVYKLLQAGPANWAELQTSPSVPFTAQFEEKICSKELLGCDYSTKQWRAKLNRAGDDIKKGEAKLAAKVKAEKEAEAKKKRKQKQEKNEKEEFKREQEKKKSAARRASLKGLTKALRSGPQYVRCETTQGPLLVKLQPTASPLGVERLLKLVRENFFTDVALWRNVPGFLVQFGLKSKGQAKEYERILDDKPLIKPKFTRGAVSFAGSGQDSRTTQLFFAYCRKCNLGDADHETIVGKLVGAASMETLDKIEKGSDYGDMSAMGNPTGPDYDMIEKDPAYLRSKFPKLDYLTKCEIVSDPKKAKDEL